MVKSAERFLVLKPTHLSSATKPVQDKQSDWQPTLAGLAGAAYTNRNPQGMDGCWEFMSAVMQNVHDAAGSAKAPLTLNTLKAFTWTVDAALQGYPLAEEATLPQIQAEIEAVQLLTEQEAKPVKMAVTIYPSSNKYISPQIEAGLQEVKFSADPSNENPEVDEKLRPSAPVSIARRPDNSLEIGIRTPESLENAPKDSFSAQSHLAGLAGDALANIMSSQALPLSVGESIGLIDKVMQNSFGSDLKDREQLTLGDLSKFAQELDSEIWARAHGVQGTENQPRDPTLVFDPQFPVDHLDIDNIALSERVLSGARDREFKQQATERQAAERPLFELIADESDDDEDGVFV